MSELDVPGVRRGLSAWAVGWPQIHLDVMWSSTDVPHWRTSPSYALLSTPTSSVGSFFGNYYVPASNPGLLAFAADNPTFPSTVSAGPTAGATVPIPGAVLFGTSPFLPGVPPGALVVATRPFAVGGNPMFGYGPSEGKREFDSWRFSGNLTGEAPEVLRVVMKTMGV